MIVQRITWQLKPGCKKKIIEMLTAGPGMPGFTVRLYSFIAGGDDETVVAEIELEKFEDMAKFWAEMAAQPGHVEATQTLQQAMLSGGSHELLRLH
jgi:hypothetical protein